MRNLLFILLWLLPFFAAGQIQTTNIGFVNGKTILKGGTISDSVFTVPIRDTIAWNNPDIRSIGRLTIRPQDSLLYYHTGAKWVLLIDALHQSGGGGGSADSALFVTISRLTDSLKKFVRYSDSGNYYITFSMLQDSLTHVPHWSDTLTTLITSSSLANALSGYQPLLGYTAENVANKRTDLLADDNITYPSTHAVHSAISDSMHVARDSNAVLRNDVNSKLSVETDPLYNSEKDQYAKYADTGILIVTEYERKRDSLLDAINNALNVKYADSLFHSGGDTISNFKDIYFSATTGTVTNTKNVITGTGVGIGNRKIAKGKDGYIYMPVISGQSQNMIYALDTSANDVTYNTMHWGMTIAPGNELYSWVDGTSTDVGSLSGYYGIRLNRKGAVITIDKTVDRKTWTTVYTFSDTSSSELNIYYGGASGSSLFYPIAYNSVTSGIILGNSTIASWLGQDTLSSLILTQSEKDKGYSLYNIAYPGDSIVGQTNTWLSLSQTQRLSFNYAIVEVGLNDLNPAIPISYTLTKYQLLINTLRNGGRAGLNIIVNTMTPCKNRLLAYYGGVNGPLAYQKWLDINTAIMGGGLTPINNVDYRQMLHTTMLNDGSGNLSLRYDLGDGIHFNNEAKSIVAYVDRYSAQSIGMLDKPIYDTTNRMIWGSGNTGRLAYFIGNKIIATSNIYQTTNGNIGIGGNPSGQFSVIGSGTGIISTIRNTDLTGYSHFNIYGTSSSDPSFGLLYCNSQFANSGIFRSNSATLRHASAPGGPLNIFSLNGDIRFVQGSFYNDGIRGAIVGAHFIWGDTVDNGSGRAMQVKGRFGATDTVASATVVAAPKILANGIDLSLKIDSITVRNDSLFEWKNGSKTFRYLHTAGGGGGTNPVIYVQTADASVTASATETNMLGTGNGSATLSAGLTNHVGDIIEVYASGQFILPSSASGNSVWKLYYGSTALATSPTMDISSATGAFVAGTGNWEFIGEIVTRTTGSTGTVMVTGTLTITGTASGNPSFPYPYTVKMDNVTATTVNLTTTQAITLTQKFSTGQTGKTANGKNCIIKYNPTP